MRTEKIQQNFVAHGAVEGEAKTSVLNAVHHLTFMNVEKIKQNFVVERAVIGVVK